MKSFHKPLPGIALCVGLAATVPAHAGSDRLLALDIQDQLDRTRVVVDDSVITGKVKTALLRDRDIKSLGISVETNDGEVTLRGTVEDKRQAQRAEKIAQEIEGVRNVTSQLAVRGEEQPG